MNGKMTKRRQQALETRKKILHCALELFEKKGYDKVTMVEIAEAAEVAVGSIYRYYKSKSEIAAQSTEPLDDVYREFFRELSTSEEYKTYSAFERLEIFYVFVQKTCSLYGNLRSLYIYNLKNRESNSLIMADNRELYRDYQLLLNECRKEASIKEEFSNDVCIDLFLQSSRGMIVDWLIRNEQFDFEKQAKLWFSVISQAIRK